MTMLPATALLLLAVLASPADAAGIYRCGPDGRTYSQTPCADGRLIDAADPRSDAERAEAKRVAARERNTAADLERERRARELVGEKSAAAGFDHRPAVQEAPASAAKPKRRTAKDKAVNKDFVAVEPRKPN
jgi:hypothetical protein